MTRQSGLADREPCPWRIVDDVGGAFCMGCIGGGLWHTVKGARMAPAGARLAGPVDSWQRLPGSRQPTTARVRAGRTALLAAGRPGGQARANPRRCPAGQQFV